MLRSLYGIIVLASFLAGTSLAAPGHSTDHSHHQSDIGKPGDQKKPARSISLMMTDAMRFNPDTITVKKGENLRFLVKNSGEINHEMVIGTKKDLEEHLEIMKKFPEMEHEDENSMTLKPKKTGELFWSFTKSGTYYIGCLIPGHFESGMIATVIVK